MISTDLLLFVCWVWRSAALDSIGKIFLSDIASQLLYQPHNLFFQIAAHHIGKIREIPDIGKILSKNFLLRRQILFFSGKDAQYGNSPVSESADLSCRIPEGKVQTVGFFFCFFSPRQRIAGALASRHNVIGSAVA